MKYNFFQKVCSEFLGTFILSSIILATLIPNIPFPIATPVAAALTLAVCVYLFGGISGCNINPAISLALLVARKIDLKHFVSYVIAQFLGGYVALLFMSVYIPEAQQHWVFVQQLGMGPLLGEALGTAFFAFCIATMAQSEAFPQAALGVFVGLSLLVGITIAHISALGFLNPAVAIAAKAWNWEYVLAPFIGGVIGSIVSMLLLKQPSMAK